MRQLICTFIVISCLCINTMECQNITKSENITYKEAEQLANSYLHLWLELTFDYQKDADKYFHSESIGNPGGEDAYSVIVSSDFRFKGMRINKDNDLELEYEFTQLAEYFVQNYPEEGQKKKWYIKTDRKKIPLIVTMKQQDGVWKIYEISDEYLEYLDNVLAGIKKDLDATRLAIAQKKEKQNESTKEWLRIYDTIYAKLSALKNTNP